MGVAQRELVQQDQRNRPFGGDFRAMRGCGDVLPTVLWHARFTQPVEPVQESRQRGDVVKWQCLFLAQKHRDQVGPCQLCQQEGLDPQIGCGIGGVQQTGKFGRDDGEHTIGYIVVDVETQLVAIWRCQPIAQSLRPS